MSITKTEIICESCDIHYAIAHKECDEPKYCPYCQSDLEYIESVSEDEDD